MSSNLLPGMDRGTIVKVVAIWLVISGVLGLCFALPLLGVGALGGVTGLGAAAGGAGADAAALASASGVLLILGLVSLVVGPVSLVIAWGLYNRRQWSRMGVVILMGISAILNLLFILMGNGLINNLIPLLIDGFVAYFFYTDAGIQQTLSN